MVFSKLRASVALFAYASLASASSHMIMGGLNPIVIERVDPIVNPGGYASHVHSVMGASNFDQNSNNVTLRQAGCTSVPFQKVDLSAYWAPSVHYQDQNTHQLTLMPTSFNIYYFFDRQGPNEVTKAFPAGLRMVAGNPNRGTYNASNFADKAVSFVCLDYSGAVSNNPAYAERQDINFPNVNACKNGLRYQVFFPMCWDGVNLDSADHKSHMAYPVDNYNSGTCPSSHPVHLVGLFFEMMVPTSGYNYWGPGAYVLSSGDPTGLAFHGDFMNGWDVPVLEDAVENCHNMNGDINACQVLQPYIDQDAAHACTLTSQVVNENVQGPIAALPGCNPIQVPTGSAPKCSAPAAAPGFKATVDPLAAGWTDVGCISEASNGRALTGASTTSPQMSLNFCANFCQSKGFKLAGIEFGDECYCGNSLSNGATTNTVAKDKCNTPCASNPDYAMCGGPRLLELLQMTGAAAPPPPVQSTPAAPPPPPVQTSQAAPPPPMSSSSAVATTTPVVAPPPPPPATSSTPAATTSAIFVQKPSSSSSAAAAAAPTAGTSSWVASGCSVDGPARALTGYSLSDPNMTTAKCTAACESHGFNIAGTEYTTECYCGNSFQNNLGQAQDNRFCYMSCGGARDTKCGGTWSLNIYKLQNKRSRHFGRQVQYRSNQF